jgi:hypothetical protein
LKSIEKYDQYISANQKITNIYNELG